MTKPLPFVQALRNYHEALKRTVEEMDKIDPPSEEKRRRYREAQAILDASPHDFRFYD